MGLSLWLQVDTGGKEPASIEGADFGITHNVQGMFCKAFGMDVGLGYYFVGRTAESTIPEIERAIADMEAHKEEYEVMNPKNGWGSRDSALEFLRRIHAAAVAHPKATWGHSS